MSRRPSADDQFALWQLAELQERLAPLERDAGDVDPLAARAVLEQSAAVLKRAGEYEESDSLRQLGERTGKVNVEGAPAHGREQNLAHGIGEAALSIGISAIIGAGIAGPYVAMALQAPVAEKVVEASISSAAGALVGETVAAARARRERERNAKVDKLTERVGELERVVAKRQEADRGDTQVVYFGRPAGAPRVPASEQPPIGPGQGGGQVPQQKPVDIRDAPGYSR
ncbi:hypothetical protein [Actinomycetospora sp. NBC_00405]|uniref:hypothetical protein n=1 Tax=Actinomycetospora sp. NBC_00405 TaxID=2975952 RepID=UPI002E222FC5